MESTVAIECKKKLTHTHSACDTTTKKFNLIGSDKLRTRETQMKSLGKYAVSETFSTSLCTDISLHGCCLYHVRIAPLLNGCVNG